jgi:hypothetical protein
MSYLALQKLSATWPLVKYELPNSAEGQELSATWPGRGSDTISFPTLWKNELPKSVVGLEPGATWYRRGP